MKNPSVLHVCNNTTGGGETYFRNFLVLCDNYVLLELYNNNPNLISFKEKYISLKPKFDILTAIKSFFKFVSYVNSKKPEIINAEDYQSLIFTLIYSYIPFLYKPKKYYYTKHDPKLKSHLIFDVLQQIYFNKCKAVFCISNSTKYSLENFHKGRFLTIYNGIFFPELKYRGQEDENTIFFFGRLVYKKGIDLLIDAFNSLDLKDYKLVIAGVASDKGILDIVKKNKNTVYAGVIGEEEKVKYLLRSKLVVIPSRVEGFGYTALESLYFRKKPETLIVSDIPPFKEILGDFPTYFESDNVEDLKLKLRHIIDNIDKFKNRDVTNQIMKFSSKNMVESYYKVYNTD